MGQMAEGNYAIGTKIEEKYVGQFVALKDAMRKMNRQMNSTLQQVEEAAAGICRIGESCTICPGVGRRSNRAGRICGRTDGNHYEYHRCRVTYSRRTAEDDGKG